MESRPLVVVGAGISGTAAAIQAAEVGVSVSLIDENPIPNGMVGMNVPHFFGQSLPPGNESASIETFIPTTVALAEAEELGVDVRLGTCVWGAFRNRENSRLLDGPQVGLADTERSWMMNYERLIIATGARDLSIGFAGWDLAGVMGANGAHSLMNRSANLASRRMVLLGSGNLGLKTAKMALENGIEVVAVVDVSPTVQGDEALVEALRTEGVKFFTSHTVKEAAGKDGCIESVVLVGIDDDGEPVAGTEKMVSADIVCLAIGLVPNVELLSLLDCELTFKSELGGYVPRHDDRMRTSVDDVFVAGDAAGFHDGMIIDPDIARNQGRLAGIAASASLGAIGSTEAEELMSEIRSEILSQACAKPTEVHTGWKRWLGSFVKAGGQDVLACPCEGVTRAEIIGLQPPRYLEWGSEQMNRRSLQTQVEDNPANPNQIKRLTRAGTGICQGRQCREQVALLLAEEANTPISEIPLMTYRPPVRPLPLSIMWPDDESEDVRTEWPKWFSPNNKVLG